MKNNRFISLAETVLVRTACLYGAVTLIFAVLGSFSDKNALPCDFLLFTALFSFATAWGTVLRDFLRRKNAGILAEMAAFLISFAAFFGIYCVGPLTSYYANTASSNPVLRYVVLVLFFVVIYAVVGGLRAVVNAVCRRHEPESEYQPIYTQPENRSEK